MLIAVVIPVYKLKPSDDERNSLTQCLSVLGKYPIVLVCPEGLDIAAYDAILPGRLQKQTFADHFFASIEGYNRLLTSPLFYERFSCYDYVLIYQLDAWVFRDELEEWSGKGYDYVGAPWFEHYLSHEEGSGLWLVGNGGLSLRRTEKFLAVTAATSRLHPYTRIKDCHQVFATEYHSLRDLPRCLLRCLGPWVGTNSVRHVRKHLQEDSFFCKELYGSDWELRVPSLEEAALFSFERSPKFLYEEVAHGRLPFGCHAWRRYQWEDFWQQHIMP